MRAIRCFVAALQRTDGRSAGYKDTSARGKGGGSPPQVNPALRLDLEGVGQGLSGDLVLNGSVPDQPPKDAALEEEDAKARDKILQPPLVVGTLLGLRWVPIEQQSLFCADCGHQLGPCCRFTLSVLSIRDIPTDLGGLCPS